MTLKQLLVNKRDDLIEDYNTNLINIYNLENKPKIHMESFYTSLYNILRELDEINRLISQVNS